MTTMTTIKTITCAIALLAGQGFAQEAATQTAEPQQATQAQPKQALADTALPKTWVQGTPITAWQKDVLYVVEGFATWCGPCKRAIPHVEELYHALSNETDVVLFSICVMDKKSVEDVRAVLAKQSVVPTYPMALDTENTILNAWLNPLQVNGVPFVLIVKNGLLEWRGHPVDLTLELIRAVKAGKTPPAPTPTMAPPPQNPYDTALDAKDYAKAESVLRELIEQTTAYQRLKKVNRLPAWLSNKRTKDPVLDPTPRPVRPESPKPDPAIEEKCLAYYRAIRAADKAGDTATAKAKIAEALADPTIPGNWCAMYTYLAVGEAYEAKNYQSVIDQLEVCVNRFPTDPQALGFVQEILSKVEELQDVGDTLHLRVILGMAKYDKRPDSDYAAVCYSIAAKLAEKLGKPEDALKYSEQALEASLNAQRLKALLDGRILQW